MKSNKQLSSINSVPESVLVTGDISSEQSNQGCDCPDLMWWAEQQMRSYYKNKHSRKRGERRAAPELK